MKTLLNALLLGASLCCAGAATVSAQSRDVGWDYSGGPKGDHYAPVIQITAANVGQLKQVWKFDMESGGLEAQSLIVGDTLYAVTPTLKLVALNAATGTLKWSFEPNGPKVPGGQTLRGLTSWTDGKVTRIVFPSQNLVFLIDAKTGKPVPSFGDQGHIDARENLRGPAENNAIFLSTPPIVYKNLIIIGGGREGENTPASPGDARAYDVHTGKLRWTFHTIPHPGEVGAETWPKDAYLTQGGANAWPGATLDVKRGIVYLNTGSAADDFYGAARLGSNRFANSTIALNARTGKRIWDFQLVHHDVWDSDSTSPPLLLTLTHDGKKTDAVVAMNKRSYVFTFDRVTGKPLFPIEEKEFPASTVPGEQTWPTQPIPTLPHSLSPTSITVDDLTDASPEANAWAHKAFSELNHPGEPYIPLTLGKNTLVMAGFLGGPEWGGAAADPNGILYVNSSNIPGIAAMQSFASLHVGGVGQTTFLEQCSSCHGRDRAGNPPEFPSLVNVAQRMTSDEILAVLKGGRGRMPPFGSLPAATLNNVVAYLTTGADLPGTPPPPPRNDGSSGQGHTPYVFTGFRTFLEPDDSPALKPPVATLNAVDMNTGQYRWSVPYSGVTANGGPVVTATGLLFINADSQLQAFDTRTGKLLWQGDVPAAGTTPAIYMVGGREYIVVGTGGRRASRGLAGFASAAGRGGQNAGAVAAAPAGAYVAFALPD